MAAYYQLAAFVPQFVDVSGNPLTGGTLNVYEAGTSTPATLYTDVDGTSAGSVITLNSRGYPSVSGSVFTPCGVRGESYKFVLKDSSGATVYTTDNIGETRVTVGGTVYVDDFGAVGDGVTDDGPAIASAYAALQSAGSGKMEYRSCARYFIGSGAYLESADHEDPSQNVGPFIIDGNGATIVMDGTFARGSTPINSVLKEALTLAGVRDTVVRDLHFVGTGTSLSTATTSNRYNVTDPGHEGTGIRVQGFKNVKVEGCSFYGLSLALVINDDDPRDGGAIPATTPVDSYIYAVLSNRFYHCWQALSFTYGGNARGEVMGNYVESSVTKLINHYGTIASSRALGGNLHDITGNTFKNCPAVTLGLNNCSFHHNKLDNVVGGVWINAGSDYPSSDYDYGLRNIRIDDNDFDYTELWTTAAESGMKPICSLYVGTAPSLADSRTVVYDNLSFDDNNIFTSCIASSSAGIILLSTTNALSEFVNLSISGNKITTTDSNGTFLYGSAYTGAEIAFTGRTRINKNTFKREDGLGGAANLEIQLGSTTPMTSARTNVLEFCGNHYHGSGQAGTVMQFDRFAVVRFHDNDMFIANAATSTTPVIKMRGCPKIFASHNNVVKAGSDDTGYFVGYSFVTTADQTAMETLRIKSSHNYISRAVAGFYPVDSFTFATGYGLLESEHDSIGNPAYVWFPNLANVDARCVVNPTGRDLTSGSYISATNALTVVHEGYSVKTRMTGTGNATGFRLTSGAWKVEGTLP